MRRRSILQTFSGDPGPNRGPFTVDDSFYVIQLFEHINPYKSEIINRDTFDSFCGGLRQESRRNLAVRDENQSGNIVPPRVINENQ